MRRWLRLDELPEVATVRGGRVDDDGWLTATPRLESIEAVGIDVLSLGPDIEVLEPPELRQAVADRARRTARLYRAP